MWRRVLWVLWVWLTLGIAPAQALPWHVPDQASADGLQQAVDSLWPESGVTVLVGEPALGEEGVRSVEGEVRLVRNGRVLASAAASPAEAVVLVRTWLREDDRDLGWVPQVRDPVPEPDPVPDVVADPEPVQAPDPDLTEPPYFGSFNVRESLLQAGSLDGGGLGAGVSLERYAALALSFTGSQNSSRVSVQDEVLAGANRRGTIASRGDAITGALMVHGWVPRRTARITPTPSALVGFELRSTVTRVTDINLGTPQVTLLPDSAAVDYGPIFGAGVTVWAANAAGGVRLTVVDRMRWTRGPRPVDDELIDPRIHEPSVIGEVFVGFGSP